MNRQQLLNLAKRRLDERRRVAEEKCDEVLRNLRKDERWQAIEHNLRKAEVDFVMKEGESKKLAQKQIADLKKKRDAFLKARRLTSGDLLPHYACTKCGDTGYVNGNICECLQEEIRQLIISESNITNRDFTFENSTEKEKENVGVYKKVKKICLGESSESNVLIYGNTGSGKTYLLTACANLCADKGKSVLFLTAYSLNSMFLDAHLSNFATHQAIMDSLIDVDVLIIDDLGTENAYKNVTAEYFFSLINERIARRKQTFISTNLTLNDIRERYDERIFSRLVDKSSTFIHPLVGDDKRIKKV